MITVVKMADIPFHTVWGKVMVNRSCILLKKTHMDRQNKEIDDTVPSYESLRLDGTQNASEEELRIFWNTNGIYDTTRLKLLGCLVTNVAMHEKKFLIGGTWNVESMNMGKVNRVKDEMNQSTLTSGIKMD